MHVAVLLLYRVSHMQWFGVISCYVFLICKWFDCSVCVVCVFQRVSLGTLCCMLTVCCACEMFAGQGDDYGWGCMLLRYGSGSLHDNAGEYQSF